MSSTSSGFELPDDTHFLNRISYGPTAATTQLVQQLGWETVLENQLHPENIDTQYLEDLLAQELPVLGLSPKQIAESEDSDIAGQAISAVIAASVIRQLYSEAQLYERMVEFWSDHFNINIFDARIFVFKGEDDRAAIRPHALGKFRDLLFANAASPAMLLYLDNYSNTKQGPNENYARELLELHTLGVDGGYTEADVVEVARAFTGWTINRESLEFEFRLDQHDRGKKRVLGKKIKTIQNGGIGDAQQVLEILAVHPSTARFICTKIARRFVSDDPGDELVDELSQVFLETDGDIKEILRSLFHSEEFWNSKEAKMKRPVDFITSALRRFDIEVNDGVFDYLSTKLQQMGQVPFSWQTPDGYPDTAHYWTNTAALVSRWNAGKDTAEFLPRARYKQMLGTARTANEIIQAMAVALIDRKLSKAEQKQIKLNVFPKKLPNKPIKGNLVPFARSVAMVLMGSRYFQMR